MQRVCRLFVQTKAKLEFLANALQAGVRSRFTTDLDFKRSNGKVLLATDQCGHGIDVTCVSCVINFDVPLTATSYAQRVGRCGR